MEITLAYSPCPNDTFAFDAMVHGRVDTEGLRFATVLADVEELNHRAFDGTYAVTKLSYHALAHLQDRYRLLDAGSALGEGIGPLLIAREQLTRQRLEGSPIAIPGEFTTAAFLQRLAYPRATDLRTYVFSDIEAAIAAEEVAAGVIIHETRFTYAERGFELLLDLGAFWEQTTRLPIPLGGIAVRRDLPTELQQRLARVMRRSVEYALAHPTDSAEYVAAHAQEMSADIQYRHIRTYVNDYTVSLGERGREAVAALFAMAHERGVAPAPVGDLVVGV